MPLLSDVDFIFMRSVVLTPNVPFLGCATVALSKRFGANRSYARYGLAGGWRK